MATRRVVTGHDAEGKAVFASDEEVQPVTLSLVPGMEFHLLWGSDATGAFPDDGTKPEGPKYFPPAGVPVSPSSPSRPTAAAAYPRTSMSARR